MKHTVLSFSLLVATAPGFAAATASPAITQDQATQTAMQAVPGGRVKSVELEHEGGRDVWSFDITRHGIKGATEIQVDAKSGAIVSRKHESAAAEAHEAKSEKSEKSRR